MELRARMRDLETMMIDFKSNMERRIQTSLEDAPQKWIQQFKMLEEKETHLWKQQSDKGDMINNQLVLQRDTQKRQMDKINESIFDLKKQLDDVDFKTTRMAKNYESLQMKFNSFADVSRPQLALTNNAQGD